jgi:hypothetical protein
MSARPYAHAAGALLLALGTGIAAATSVSTNYLPETDFSSYHTYRWVAVQGPDGAETMDSITEQQIKRAVDKQLAAKGWTHSDAGEVDAYVGFQLAVEQRQHVNVYGGWGWYGGTSVTESTSSYGTLTLDVYDPKLKSLVWRGSASDTLRAKVSPEKRQARIDKAVGKLLAKFPPKKK